MIIKTEELIAASSVSINNGVVELELYGKVENKEELQGEVLFMCRLGDSIVIVTGAVEKYEEIVPDPDLSEQDLIARLYIRGRELSFTI